LAVVEQHPKAPSAVQLLVSVEPEPLRATKRRIDDTPVA
jgi:hypothetical protein